MIENMKALIRFSIYFIETISIMKYIRVVTDFTKISTNVIEMERASVAFVVLVLILENSVSLNLNRNSQSVGCPLSY